MKRRIFIWIGIYIFVTSSFAEEKRAIVFAEAISANGVRAIIGHDNAQSRTRFVVTIPLQYIIDKEKSWEKISRDWVSSNPTRELFQLPSELKPLLIVECDEVLDEGALYQLLQKTSNSNWTKESQTLRSQRPAFSWFKHSGFRNSNHPKANEFVYGVISKQSIENSWRWIEQNTTDWVGKISVFRENGKDTTVSNSIVHRLGQQVDVICYQPISNAKIAIALNSESEKKSIAENLEREFLKRNILFTSLQTSLYPKLDPSYFYIQITGNIDHLNDYLSYWNVAWQEYLLSSPIISVKSKQPILSLPNVDLETKCMQRIYPRMTQQRSMETTNEEISNGIQNEKWSTLIFVDTTRYKPSLDYKIRKD